jgi:hypothetical protein
MPRDYTNVTITIPSRLSPDDQRKLKLLFKDALGEFISTRQDVPRYVDTRYADHPQPFRDKKMLEVAERVGVALVVKPALDDLQVTDDSDQDRD